MHAYFLKLYAKTSHPFWSVDDVALLKGISQYPSIQCLDLRSWQTVQMWYGWLTCWLLMGEIVGSWRSRFHCLIITVCFCREWENSLVSESQINAYLGLSHIHTYVQRTWTSAMTIFDSQGQASNSELSLLLVVVVVVWGYSMNSDLGSGFGRRVQRYVYTI